MRSEGFTAREAMGWLRIMRPGSVIGEQQRYLCAVEAARPRPQDDRRPPAAPQRANSEPSLDKVGGAEAGARAAAELAAQVAEGMARRCGSARH